MILGFWSERVQGLRAAYRQLRGQIEDKASLYIDESGANLDLTSAFGRAPSPQRAYDEKPTAKGERISTVGVLSPQGLKTAFCFEGTLNGAIFLFFLEHFLCPFLKPGQWVIMDNAPAHKVEGVALLIEETGAHLLYLPPYSPEYNPLELAWSVVKQKLRALKARDKEALYEAWAIALKAISPAHAKQFFQHTCKVLT